MCGTKGIKSYPVREEKGVIFTFVGDIDPPPLEWDVAPGFFDEDVAICVADPYVVKANWRLAAGGWRLAAGGWDPRAVRIRDITSSTIGRGLP